MASYSQPVAVEQTITDFFGKSLHVILESRCLPVSSRNYSGEQLLSSPSPASSASSSSSFRKRYKSFHLENIEFWRQSNCGSITVDIVLQSNSDGLNFSPNRGIVQNYSSDADEFGIEAKNEKIIERWVMEFESKKSGVEGRVGKQSSCASSQTFYKKTTLLLRSLYATVRLLPAYKLFCDLISSPRIELYNLGHRVSSFVEPFTSREEADMQDFAFAPLDTSCGRISLSVKYCRSVLVVSSEPSTPMTPKLIPEYVGSPLAEPLKRLPSGPIPRSAPSSTPFGRRHSWSYDLYRASPSSVNPSPSPTSTDYDALLSKERYTYHPPTGLPRPLHDEVCPGHEKNPSYDDYWPSPMLSPSPSPSPSPPTHVSGSRPCKVLLQSESDLGVTASRLSSMASLPKTRVIPPSAPMKATQLTVYKKAAHLGLNQTSSTAVNQLSSSKDKTGKLLDVKSLPNSSQSNSRLSSRLPFPNDYDDFDFSGPFILDDDDSTDPESRPGSSDLPSGPDGMLSSKKTQNSTVGALVCMLQKAPALASDTNSEKPGGTVQASISTSKTATDALEELRMYSEMRDKLVKKG